jgi:hypothetical protein
MYPFEDLDPNVKYILFRLVARSKFLRLGRSSVQKKMQKNLISGNALFWKISCMLRMIYKGEKHSAQKSWNLFHSSKSVLDFGLKRFGVLDRSFRFGDSEKSLGETSESDARTECRDNLLRMPIQVRFKTVSSYPNWVWAAGVRSLQVATS